MENMNKRKNINRVKNKNRFLVITFSKFSKNLFFQIMKFPKQFFHWNSE